jgi:hypothetical protein
MREVSKIAMLIAKLKRYLGITKEVELSVSERRIIKFAKLHYGDKYPKTGEWTGTFKPLFQEIYGWDPNEYYQDYLDCTFKNLLKIFGKISEDQYTTDRVMSEVFDASFKKYLWLNQELPIERAIAKLFGAIQNTSYLDMYKIKRYDLHVDGDPDPQQLLKAA